MSRRRSSYTPPRCTVCRALTVWVARADGTGVRLFDAKPLNGHQVPANVIAYPVFGGQAWSFADLVTHFMHIRDCSRADAETEARHVPWHRAHPCTPTTVPDAEEVA